MLFRSNLFLGEQEPECGLSEAWGWGCGKGQSVASGGPPGTCLPLTPSWSTHCGHQDTGPEALQAPLGWLLHLCLVISAQYCQPGLVGT